MRITGVRESVGDIAAMITKGVLADGGPLQSTDVDPAIREVGTLIINMAKSNLVAAGRGQPRRRLEEINAMLPRIGWAKEPIVTWNYRLGMVVSNHPASVRWEFGTAKSYPPSQFMAKAGLEVAAQVGAEFRAKPQQAPVAEVVVA